MGPLTETCRSLNGSIDESFGMDRTAFSLCSRAHSSLNYTEDFMALDSAFSDTSFYNDNDISDEGRLSRALQSWMSDHVITPIEPLNKPPVEPVYSGRLGKRPILQRVPSEESIETNLSLLSCSSGEDKPNHSPNLSRVSTASRRRKGKKKDRASTATGKSPIDWEQMVKKRKGHSMLEQYSRANQVDAIGVSTLIEEEDELFQMLDKDIQKALFRCGITRGIKLVKNVTKSASMSNIHEACNRNVESPKKVIKSAGSTPRSGPLNFEEIRQQMLKKKFESMAKKSGVRDRKGRRSRMSSVSSIATDIIPATPSIRSLSPALETEKVTVWKGDREILEMDLRRGLTKRVQRRINATTLAISRVTGVGEHNVQQRVIGRHEEFPNYVAEDYGNIPKIMQRIRISAHLSHVIKDDIKVRMGRPRYHEISVKDLKMWNKGQELNRAHRNLKVFNWLHSLREDRFEYIVESSCTEHRPYTTEDLAILHVESADEPDATPLYLKKFEIMKPR